MFRSGLVTLVAFSQSVAGHDAVSLLQMDSKTIHAHANHPKEVHAPKVHESPNAEADVMDANKVEYHDLVFTNIVHNNLGGLGPDFDKPEGIRYGGATKLNGRPIDFVISSENYASNITDRNGVSGALGVINIQNGATVNFRARFLEAGTDKPVVMGKFYLSVFDIDTGKAGGKETLSVDGFEEKYLLDGSELDVQLGLNTGVFSGGNHGVAADNPSDPLMLTDVAAARTVTFLFPEGKTEIAFSYAVALNGDGSDSERQFLFAGMSSLYFCKAKKVDIDFSLAKVLRSNLGNRGPDYDQPEGLRFGNIADIGFGTFIDMEINAISPYKVKNSAQNGLNGKFGQVNIMSDASTQFAFRFLEAGTDLPVIVDWIYFSVYDLDQGAIKTPPGKFKEAFDIQGFSTQYLTESSQIEVTELGGGLYRYASTQKGNGKDNPREPMHLDQKQKDRSVTFLFHKSSGFNATFSVGTPAKSGRNFLFAGKSSTVFC